ncbi:mfs drug, partial [Moniliophthora roreri]
MPVMHAAVIILRHWQSVNYQELPGMDIDIPILGRIAVRDLLKAPGCNMLTKLRRIIAQIIAERLIAGVGGASLLNLSCMIIP